MTLVKIDIKNVASETHPDDRVVFYSPTVREAAGGGITSTAETVVPLVDGIGEKDLNPGPVTVTLECRGIADTRPKSGTVPDVGPVDIADVIGESFTYTPPITNAALEQINAARDSALGEVSGAVAAEVGAIKWHRGSLAETSNIDALGNGIFASPSIAITTALNLPSGQPGYVESVWLDDSGSRRRQTFRADPAVGYQAYRRTYFGGAWSAWVRIDTGSIRADLDSKANITQVATQVDAAKWSRPPLAGTENVDTLPNGLHPVPTTTVATALGLPIAQSGELVTTWLDNSGVRRRQTLYVDPPTGADAGLHIFRRWYYNGTWQPWGTAVKPSTPYFRGAVPAGVTPESMTGTAYQGLWTYSSAQAAVWSIPSQAAGMIEVATSGASTLHQVVTLTTPIRNFQRRWYNGTWSGDWETLGGGSVPEPVEADEYAEATSKNALNLLVPSTVDPTLTYVADHAALVADLKTRIGTVSTGGKAAVALVADHGTTAFRDWLWDAAKARNIPFTMALAPEVHLDGKGDSRHLATNAEIKQWISEGLVIASHSGDHDGATGYFDVARQIVTSKKKLEEKLETTVDCWVQPGYVLANGSYDGFSTGQSAERYTDFYAGRLLQQAYPVVTGYAGDDFVYPGDQDLPVGVRRSLTERKDAYQGVLDYIQQAITTGGKHINFCHPYALPDSSTTYVTKAEYIAYLDWLVTKRDAGDLVLLTLPQLMVARP